MQFLEEGDFINFDEEENEEEDVLRCHKCKQEFKVPTDTAPTNCPGCGIKFLPEGST